MHRCRRGAAWGGHLGPEPEGALVGLAQQNTGATDRLEDETFGSMMRQAFPDGGLGQSFGQQEDICGARAGHGGDGVEEILAQLDRLTNRCQYGLRDRRRILTGPGAQAVGGHRLVDGLLHEALREVLPLRKWVRSGG